MPQSILECKTKSANARTIVMSPIIGRAVLKVSTGEVVQPGAIIGEMWRLNRKFTLKLPDNCVGKIVLMKGRDRVMPLAFGEALLELEETVEHMHAKGAEAKTSERTSASVDAPMDGMFYLAPSPKDPPYVKVGDVIAPGQTIGLIEVMKCFYPLKYQGRERVKIVDIKVKSASPVSLGAKILILEDG